MSNAPVTVQEDAIRALAYKFWEEEGRPSGRDYDHWLRAVAAFEVPSLMAEPAAEKPKKKTKSKR